MRRRAQPKKSESLNQIYTFSQSLTENFFKNKCFTPLSVVRCAQPKK